MYIFSTIFTTVRANHVYTRTLMYTYGRINIFI